MKSCIFLIKLLGFIQFVFCSEIANISEDVCPVTWFRRKRATMEYTRWRSNIATTPEFIVKVLDDELSTAPSKQIVAVNIMPETKRGEKIIVGGAMVPPPTPTAGAPDANREYTRFVPPTTVAHGVATSPALGIADFMPIPATRLLNLEYNQPVTPERRTPQLFPMRPSERGPYRDDSPPVSPQFLRTTDALAQQYAPIAPVAFTRRPTKEVLYNSRHAYEVPNLPTRTTSETAPSRTTLDDFTAIQAFLEEIIKENEIMLERSTQKKTPDRTIDRKDLPNLYDDSDFSSSSPDENRKELNYADASFVTEETQNLRRFKGKDKDLDIDGHPFYQDELEDVSSTPEKHDEKSTSSTTLTEKTTKTSSTVTVLKEVQTENMTGELETYDESFEEPEKNVTASTVNPLPKEIKEILDSSHEEKSREKRRPVCNLIKLRSLNFNTPRTLPEIVAQLKQWTEESPLVRWTDLTAGNLTTMENPIYIMIVDDPSVGQIVSEKQNVLLVAGMQGRDHHAVASAMYILYQLIERNKNHFDLLGKYRFWIIPVLNPDGYDYSMTFPHRREWVKNLRQTWDICKGRDSCKHCDTYGLRCTISPCYGVNLDRNFEYQWIPPEELRAEHPCGGLYAGARQLSEAETQALTNYLHKQQVVISVFVALKEGDVLGVMYPYSHTRKRRAFDQVYRQRASRAAAAASSVNSRPYVAGQTSEFLPLYAGGIEDWADGHLGIDNTYTIMIFRPSDQQSKILTERVVHEAYAAMDSLLLSTVTNTVRPVSALTGGFSPGPRARMTPVVLTTAISLIYSLHVVRRNIGI